MNWEVWAFRLVFIGFVAGFLSQMITRWRLVQAAPNNFSVDQVGARVDRFISEVIFQSRVISAKKAVGIAHLAVYWGFVAFGGSPRSRCCEACVVDLTQTPRSCLQVGARTVAGVLIGIVGLRFAAVVRPAPREGSVRSRCSSPFYDVDGDDFVSSASTMELSTA
jgi:hypothetical protein